MFVKYFGIISVNIYNFNWVFIMLEIAEKSLSQIFRYYLVRLF